jgi:hypothetical protein
MGICFGNAELITWLYNLKHKFPSSLGSHSQRVKA